MPYKIRDSELLHLSPLGRGRRAAPGEGNLNSVGLAEAPSPEAFGFDLSPVGRGG
jgi:hypothetical protein